MEAQDRDDFEAMLSLIQDPVFAHMRALHIFMSCLDGSLQIANSLPERCPQLLRIS